MKTETDFLPNANNVWVILRLKKMRSHLSIVPFGLFVLFGAFNSVWGFKGIQMQSRSNENTLENPTLSYPFLVNFTLKLRPEIGEDHLW